MLMPLLSVNKVVIMPLVSKRRTLLLPVSSTYTVPSPRTHNPLGIFIATLVAIVEPSGPLPLACVPATVWMRPSDVTFRTESLSLSTIKTLPALSSMAKCGRESAALVA